MFVMSHFALHRQKMFLIVLSGCSVKNEDEGEPSSSSSSEASEGEEEQEE